MAGTKKNKGLDAEHALEKGAVCNDFPGRVGVFRRNKTPERHFMTASSGMKKISTRKIIVVLWEPSRYDVIIVNRQVCVQSCFVSVEVALPRQMEGKTAKAPETGIEYSMFWRS